MNEELIRQCAREAEERTRGASVGEVREAAELAIRLYHDRALAESAPKWRTDWENAPKETHVWVWGKSLHWRDGGVVYVHESYNGHKGVITKNGCAGHPFRITDEDAPTHFMEMVLPDAPFQKEGSQ